jgi:hypothetical protein
MTRVRDQAGAHVADQLLIRRTAHDVMDHAWEMEDRDATP